MSETAPRRLDSDPDEVTSSVPEDHPVRDLANSCKLVYLALRAEGPLTQPAIARWTGMPQRTVRSGLNDLLEANVVQYWTHTRDTRKYVYGLTDDARGDA